MTELEFNKLLRRALLDAALSDGQAALSAYDNVSCTHSARYLRWEKKLLSNPFSLARRFKRPQWAKVLRTAVIAAVITALLLGCALAAIPTFRTWVVQWFTQVATTDTTHRFENPNAGESGYTPETLPDDVRPAFIPDGYEEVNVVAFAGYVPLTYENPSGNRLLFVYQIIDDSRTVFIDSEYHETYETERNGMQVYVAHSAHPEQDFNYLIWVNEPMNVMFRVDGTVDIDTLFAIMDSVPTVF